MSRTRTTIKPAARQLVSIDAAAEHVGVSAKTLRRYVSAGRINAYRVGAKLIRVDIGELEAALLRPIPTAGTFDD